MADAVTEAQRTAQPHDPVELYGSFRFKVDSKGRMALPAKFRKVLPTELIVTPDPTDEYVRVFDRPIFDDWVKQMLAEKFGEFRSTNRTHTRARRFLKSRAADVEVDSSGRIMLSADVRSAVGIDKDVVLVGNTGYFEIWDAKRYDEDFEDFDPSMFYED
ncbi:division/cell wall cluster transcriptional repressor MraZ [Adlercreutzia sp. ZJ473]|uniref:division/cell wall cluster transcriptional repressor MraZ n=1 Tax=Adlercreutzia sp. ZJ473 TaxID=2722822 RepID=UPI001557687E|nr:division/cell wall cluster transcriptional repressor MraZ [Adlercreutzia sp. ZJ473]